MPMTMAEGVGQLRSDATAETMFDRLLTARRVQMAERALEDEEREALRLLAAALPAADFPWAA